jgi:hypothetical protein
MTTTAVAPKIVGKALYLELVADPTLTEEQSRSLLGWQHKGTKQVIVFPEYQDDSGVVYGAVVMDRVVSEHSPRSQWDISFTDRSRLKPEASDTSRGDYTFHSTYTPSEWADLTEREKFDSRKLVLAVVLKRATISTTYGDPDSEGNRPTIAKQGWVVRESKPIVVETTDQDLSDLHKHAKTPQAVIRRINKVRDTLDKFPKKLA